jgi:hypothetical protein
MAARNARMQRERHGVQAQPAATAAATAATTAAATPAAQTVFALVDHPYAESGISITVEPSTAAVKRGSVLTRSGLLVVQ